MLEPSPHFAKKYALGEGEDDDNGIIIYVNP